MKPNSEKSLTVAASYAPHVVVVLADTQAHASMS